MQIEKSHKSEGLIITVVFHAALLLLFYFMVLRTPNPPLVPTMGGGGVDLNFGDPNAGTGDLNNFLPVELASNEQLNNTETSEPTEESNTPEEVTEEVVTPTESEDAVEINAKESKDKKPEVKKAETKPTDKPVTETKKEEKPKYSFPNKSTSANSSASSKAGEDKNTPGDPGDPRGTQKGRYLYGDPGSGGGKGGGHGTGTGVGFGDGYGNWKFVGNPIPNDESSEEGKVKFLLTLDEDGNIVNAVATENLGGVSPSVLRIYIQRLKTISVEAPSGFDITPGMKIPVWYTITAK